MNATVHHCDVYSSNVANCEFRMVSQTLDLSLAVVDEAIKQISDLFTRRVLQQQRPVPRVPGKSEVDMPNRPFSVVDVESLVW